MPSEQIAVTIRRADAGDAPAMARMRVASALERNPEEPAAREAHERNCAAFFGRELGRPDSFLYAWVAELDGAVVGGASLVTYPTLPRYGSDFGGFDGRVRDVYVVPASRRRGIARALMIAVVAEANRMGLDRVTLGASSDGAPLYKSLGFEYKTDEMHLVSGRDQRH